MELKRLLLIILNIELTKKVVGFIRPLSNFTSKVPRQEYEYYGNVVQHPYAVQIYSTEKVRKPTYFEVDGWNFECSGALLSEILVLTTAKCVQDKKFYIVCAGDTATYSFMNPAVPTLVVNKAVHPLYEKGNPDYNIAMVKVIPSLITSITIHSIEICYTQNWEYLSEWKKANATVVGWEKNEDRKEISIDYTKTMAKKECGLKMKSLRIFADPVPPLCTSSCLETPYNCKNQEGALAIVNGYLYGIGSQLEDEDCETTFYTTFTSYGIAHWIEKHMQILSNSDNWITGFENK
ncbi:uncharacterized protein LOC123296644 [Chrysoperla carnea]|uniref:uncharacterized protein LOC123296644 n=1 Tax=Chrysoperla carnea TaxID=189513 RepID=UPI001D08AFA6|nr:uncharacterized protein LOC123296644 [Chrysoperla carnea]